MTVSRCSAFVGTRLLARGTRPAIARAIARAAADDPAVSVLVLDDATGRVVDVAPWEAQADEGPDPDYPGSEEPRGRGRPRLGVVAREVTLLPRHWDWLAAQPGGASAALRRLVDAARHGDAGRTAARQAQERAYRAMLALAGDLPGYEEACRALFAGDRAGFAARIAAWPEDVRDYAAELARPAGEADATTPN